MVDCKTVVVLACQVGLFHLILTQINSEMNFIAKNKCPDSQKLDTRHRGENLNARTCQDQQHVYVCTLCPLLVFNLFFYSETVLFCRMFVLLLERDGSVIRSHED